MLRRRLAAPNQVKTARATTPAKPAASTAAFRRRRRRPAWAARVTSPRSLKTFLRNRSRRKYDFSFSHSRTSGNEVTGTPSASASSSSRGLPSRIEEVK